jgi:putative cell wall-binding protein/Tol biopolymer transport system component
MTLVNVVGGVEANGISHTPVISADGSFVAFSSGATNLVPGVSPTDSQIYVWSRETREIRLVSAVDGTVNMPASQGATEPSISADGDVISFTSAADNLAGVKTGGTPQIYVRRVSASKTSLVSVDQSGSSPAPSPNEARLSSVSSDGNRIAFVSSSTLTSMPTSGQQQVYVRDVVEGSTLLASRGIDGRAGDGPSLDPSISPDGHSVIFSTTATNLQPTAASQIVRYDLDNKATTVVSSGVIRAPEGSSTRPRFSPDGRAVVFVSSSKQLTPDGESYPTKNQIFRFDLVTGARSLVTRPLTNLGGANNHSYTPAVANTGVVAFSSRATDLTGDTVDGVTTQVYVRNTGADPRVDRIGGSDRYAVSANVADDSFGPGTGAIQRTAFIASGEIYTDALSAAAAAGASAPVLLTAKDSLPQSVEDELKKFKATRIVIVGGMNTISARVESQLRALGSSVERITGVDRFAVSAEIVEQFFPSAAETAYIASGEVFPDALSGSAVAGHVKSPVLLVSRDSVPAPIKEALMRLKPKRIVVLGGSATITDGVQAALVPYATSGSVTRIAARDRFDLSAAASAVTFPVNTTTVYIASGAVFPDALSGSAAAIRQGGPVLLVQTNSVPATVAAELDRLKPTRIVVLGGINTVSEGVVTELKKHLAT